jgi:hypothetical protein
MMTETAAPPGLQTHVLDDKDGDVTITARRLGEGSSHKPYKTRWFEVAIFKDSDGQYVVHTRGVSTIPGEYTKLRVVKTSSSFEVVEFLMVEHAGERYIPRDSRRALAQAAQWDDDLMERYLDLQG